MLPIVVLLLILSNKGNIPVDFGQEKYKPKIQQLLNEFCPKIDSELILQHLSGLQCDCDLVDCIIEMARGYRQLEEENENYRERKDAFVLLYEKENDRVRELESILVEEKRKLQILNIQHQNELEQTKLEFHKVRRTLEVECVEMRMHLELLKKKLDKEKQSMLDQMRLEEREGRRRVEEKKESSKIN